MSTVTETLRRRSLIGSGLAMTALLAGCAWQSDLDALKAQNDQLQQQLAARTQELAGAKEQVGRLQGAIKYTVNSDLLFSSGGWQISERGKHIMGDIAHKLAPDQAHKLVVNGYTDNAPVGSALKRMGITSNEVLSQKRADTVMNFLISQGVKSDLISARGYGEADPVAPNNTAQGRAQNRRVEIALANGTAG